MSVLASLRGSSTAPRDRLVRTAAPLSALGLRWLLVPLGPVAVTLAVITAGYVAAGGTDPGFPPRFPTLVYGVANVLVLGGLWLRCDADVRRAMAPFGLSTGELAAAALAAAAGVALGWPATTLLADALGIARYAVPSLSSPVGAVSLFLGAVVVAPVAEEVLFRGLLLGSVLERGRGPLVAGAGSLAVFAAIHVFTAGIAGVVNALLLGALLTWLRLRFDGLAGAWLMHALNNLAEFLVALSLVPSLYAL